MKKEIIIAGAGLVGSLLSIYLTRRGYKVSIYERRADMRSEQMVAGRSINLALSDRGIKALEEVGILAEIKKIAIPMHGRLMHDKDGTQTFQPYGKEGQFINSVSRADLNIMLMNLAENEGVSIYFNKKCTQVNWENKEVSFENTDGSINKINFDVLFGSDGSFAATRLAHQLQHPRFQYHQFFINYGYKELHIPLGKENSFSIEKNALHIWPRGNYMMIALPNMDGSFTCTLFFPFEGQESFETLQTDDEVKAFFTTNFADAVALMPTLCEDFKNNPTAAMVTVKCFPWVRSGDFTLIGDAAHAMVPFFGQGMNCGFEDCFVLNKLLDEHTDDWEKTLAAYQQLRKPDADAIADMALQNFIEMRDKVADPVFLLQKKIEARFSKKYPEQWTPLYSMVTFSPQMRYSEALQRGAKQQLIMDEVMQLKNIAEIWDSETIENLMLDKIKNN